RCAPSARKPPTSARCRRSRSRAEDVGAQRVLVVGAGMAGLRTAEALRAQGFGGEVLVVGDELWAPYNRPPLSKEALKGGVDHAKRACRGRANASDVVWRLGVEVTTVDLQERQATTRGGSVLAYDALVAATGVRARRLAVPGPAAAAVAGRHVVRTLDDALALRARLTPGARLDRKSTRLNSSHVKIAYAVLCLKKN